MSESPVPLPEQPSLEQLRNQAKDLRRTSGIPLWEAQLAVARRYGFTSWARLKQHVELLDRYSRFPERVATDSDAGTFLRLACLSYDDDEPGPVGAGAADPGARAGDRRGQRLRRRPRPPTSTRCAGCSRPTRRRPRGRADRTGGSRCSTSPTPATTRRSSLDARRSRRPGCCSTPAPTRTPATSGTGCRPRSPCSPASSAKASADRSRQPRHPHSLALAPAAARGRRRPERRPGALQPDVRARQRPPRAALRVRSRAPATAARGAGDSATRSTRRPRWCAASSLGDHARHDRAGPAARRARRRRDRAVRRRHAPRPRWPLRPGTRSSWTTSSRTARRRPTCDPVDAFVAAALAADRPRLDRLLADDPGLAARAARRPPGPRRVGGGLRAPGGGRAPGRAGLRRQRQGPHRRAERPAMGDRAAQGGRRRQRRARPDAAARSAPTPTSTTSASTPPRSAGPATSASSRLIELLEPLTAGTAE